MLGKVSDLLKEAFFWMRKGVVPPSSVDTPFEETDANVNHFRSKKFCFSFFGILVVILFYIMSVLFLFILPIPEQIVALTSMYRDAMVVIAAIVTSLVGIEGLVSWAHGTTSKVNQESIIKNTKEDIKELIQEEKDINTTEKKETVIEFKGIPPKEEDYILK